MSVRHFKYSVLLSHIVDGARTEIRAGWSRVRLTAKTKVFLLLFPGIKTIGA